MKQPLLWARGRELQTLLRSLPELECHSCIPAARLTRTKTIRLTMTSISVFWRYHVMMLCFGFRSQINVPLLNWVRLDSLNHRGWWVFLVHLSLMTGQRSGWRGNRLGKFSTLLALLWLTESAIYLQKNNYSLSFLILQHSTVILATPQQKTAGDISLFFFL